MYIRLVSTQQLNSEQLACKPILVKGPADKLQYDDIDQDLGSGAVLIRYDLST